MPLKVLLQSAEQFKQCVCLAATSTGLKSGTALSSLAHCISIARISNATTHTVMQRTEMNKPTMQQGRGGVGKCSKKAAGNERPRPVKFSLTEFFTMRNRGVH